MHRFSLMILLSIMFALSAWAQQDTDTGVQETEPPESASETTSEAEIEIEDPEEVVIDDEFYQDVDDKDFRPSEDIPADQSIAFPTDI